MNVDGSDAAVSKKADVAYHAEGGHSAHRARRARRVRTKDRRGAEMQPGHRCAKGGKVTNRRLGRPARLSPARRRLRGGRRKPRQRRHPGSDRMHGQFGMLGRRIQRRRSRAVEWRSRPSSGDSVTSDALGSELAASFEVLGDKVRRARPGERQSSPAAPASCASLYLHGRGFQGSDPSTGSATSTGISAPTRVAADALIDGQRSARPLIVWANNVRAQPQPLRAVRNFRPQWDFEIWVTVSSLASGLNSESCV